MADLTPDERTHAAPVLAAAERYFVPQGPGRLGRMQEGFAAVARAAVVLWYEAQREMAMRIQRHDPDEECLCALCIAFREADARLRELAEEE